LAPGRGDIWGAFAWAAFVLAAARGAPGGRFVLTPGRIASAWFVFATTRGATVAALVPKGFPALSEDRPQPDIVTVSNAAATTNRRVRRSLGDRTKGNALACESIG
jgi:hypothetical protein